MASPRKKPARRGATNNQRKKPAKTQSAKTQSAKNQASWRVPGWLWGLAGMAAGFFLAQHQHGTAPWQAPSDASPQATVISKEARDAQKTGQTTEQEAESSMPTFEFYTLLPETEVIAPGGAPASSVNRPEVTEVVSAESPTVSPDDPIAQIIAANGDAPPERADAPSETPPGRYMLQGASFRALDDAERLRNRLRNLSLLAQISEVQARGDTWYRVQVGPYEDTRELNRAQDLMNTQGIEPLLIQLQD